MTLGKNFCSLTRAEQVNVMMYVTPFAPPLRIVPLGGDFFRGWRMLRCSCLSSASRSPW